MYKNVPILNGKVKQINTGHLYRGLANNLKNRKIITNSSHISSQNSKYRQENVNNYIELLDSLNALNPKMWPVSENGEIDDRYTIWR